jgi:hypothetical protein
MHETQAATIPVQQTSRHNLQAKCTNDNNSSTLLGKPLLLHQLLHSTAVPTLSAHMVRQALQQQPKPKPMQVLLLPPTRQHNPHTCQRVHSTAVSNGQMCAHCSSSVGVAL